MVQGRQGIQGSELSSLVSLLPQLLILSAQSNLLDQHSPSLRLWEGEPKSNLIRERPLLKTTGKDFKRDGK